MRKSPRIYSTGCAGQLKVLEVPAVGVRGAILPPFGINRYVADHDDDDDY